MPGLTLDMVPAEAIEKINGHTNNGNVGNPIGADGIENYAVIEKKLANGSVSTRTIQPGAVGLENLDSEVREAIAAGGNEGVPGLTNFIAEGLGITAGSGLTAAVQSGRASITEKTVKLTTAQNITTDARMASLIYAQKQADTDVPLIGKINSISPLATIDNNTVAMYLFNQTTAGAAIPNSAVGLSSIALANNLVASGGLKSVDGRTDYAIKGDGLTGYYTSQNITGFPTGANPVGLVVMFTVNTVPTALSFIASYGTVTAGRVFGAYIGANGNIVICIGGTDIDTGYTVSASTDYVLEQNYDGSILTLYINKSLVYTSTAITLNIGTTLNFTVLRHPQTATSYGNFTIHYIEIRNALRTAQQIADNATKLLFPCKYTGPSANYPTVATGETAYHEYKFAETSGTAVADSTGALSGIATGTTIVDSEIGLGKARKFGADTDKITCGNYDWSGLSEWTIIFSGNIASFAAARIILSNRSAGYTSGIALTTTTTGTLSLDTNVNQIVTSPLAAGSNIFFALTYKDGICYAYENSPTVTKATAVTMRSGPNPLAIGYDLPGNVSYRGIMEYLIIIPRLLSPAEVAPYYNALKNTATKDMRSLLPADAISLGTVQTDSTRVIGYNMDYKTGRRERAVGGNREALLGWKYVTSGISKDFDNPFRTENVKVSEIWFKKSLSDTKHSVADLLLNPTNTSYYGCAVKSVTAEKITIWTGNGGVLSDANSYNSTSESAGHIAIVVHMLGDD